MKIKWISAVKIDTVGVTQTDTIDGKTITLVIKFLMESKLEIRPEIEFYLMTLVKL